MLVSLSSILTLVLPVYVSVYCRPDLARDRQSEPSSETLNWARDNGCDGVNVTVP
jgi:hypothetical protein